MKANDYLGIGEADPLTLDIAQEPEYCSLCDQFHYLLGQCPDYRKKTLRMNPRKPTALDKAMAKVGLKLGLLDFKDL